MQGSIFGACSKPGQSGKVAAGRASGIKMGGDDGDGSLFIPDGVAPTQMVGVSASVIFPCAIEVQKKIFLWHRLTWLSQKKGRKTVVCVCVCQHCCWFLADRDYC